MEKKKMWQEETQQSKILADRNAATGAAKTVAATGEAKSVAAKDSGVDEETERLLREYLQQTEKLDEARNADRGRQSEALKAKLEAKYVPTWSRFCLCFVYGCVSSDDKNHVCTHGTRFQREHSFMNFNRPTREGAK